MGQEAWDGAEPCKWKKQEGCRSLGVGGYRRIGWEISTGAWEGQEYDTGHGPGISKGHGRGRSLGVGGYLNRGMGWSRSLGWDKDLEGTGGLKEK